MTKLMTIVVTGALRVKLLFRPVCPSTCGNMVPLLTLKELITTAADDILKYFFFLGGGGVGFKKKKKKKKRF